MNSEDKHIPIQDIDIAKNNKRGNLLYYSISQVATLLGQEDSSIRYYTNVFDNILKIEISDKELRYTNRDIDKLEFLINLKNKGMTIKEVQKYCEELPLNIEELVEVKENNSVSIKEIITTIVELENEQISNLKDYLINKIDESNDLYIQKITKIIVEEQNKQLKLFRDDILTEIKDYINNKFDIEHDSNKDLYSELSTNVGILIAEKTSLEDNIKSQLNKFNEISVARDGNLINEIKRFENVMERAYYVQHEIDTQKDNVSFFGRLFRVK